MTNRNWLPKSLRKPSRRPTPNRLGFVQLEDRVTPAGSDPLAGATLINPGALPFSDAGTDNTTFTGEAGEQGFFGAAFGPDSADIDGNLNTAWWSFTPTVSGTYNFNTVGSDFDTTLSLFTGTGFPLTFVAGNDDTFNLQSRVVADLTAGTQYSVQVDGFFDSTGSITLNVAPAPTTVYVSPLFDGAFGTPVADGDFSTSQAEPATAGVNAFSSVQAALNAVATGGTVVINGQNSVGGPAGSATYPENLTLNRSVFLNGVGTPTLTDSSNGPVAPTPASPKGPVGGGPLGPTDPFSDLIHVLADNITISGFTLDGGYFGGATGARRGISNVMDDGTAVVINNLDVNTNTLLNLGGRGLSIANVDGFSNNIGTSTGISVTENKFLGPFGGASPVDETLAIVFDSNVLGTIADNTVVVPDVSPGGDPGDTAGIYVQAIFGGNVTISGNAITVGRDADGIQLFGQFGTGTVDVIGNTINAAAGLTADDGDVDPNDNFGSGIVVLSVSGTAAVNVQDNLIGTLGGRFENGILAWDTGTGLTINGGFVGRSHNGLLATNYIDFLFDATADSVVTVTNGAAFTASGAVSPLSTDYGIFVVAGGGGKRVDVALSGSVALTATGPGAIGLYLQGGSAGLAGDTLGDTEFAATGTGSYIELFEFAEQGTEIDGTSAVFDGNKGSAAGLAGNWAIEDKIYHYVDDFFDPNLLTFVPGLDNNVGFVRVNSGKVYVTDNSNSVARGAAVAIAGDTILANVGTYVEPFAITLDDAGVSLFGNKGSGKAVVTPSLKAFDAADSNDNLVQVLANNLTVDGFVFDGLYDATGPVGALRGLSNLDGTGTPVAVNNLTVTNNTFQDLGGRAVSLSNDGLNTVSTGNLVKMNVIGTYGQADPTFEGVGIALISGAAADVLMNTVVVPGQTSDLFYGVYMFDFSTGTLVANQNTITVGLGGSGFSIQGFGGATFSAMGNVVNAATGVVPGSFTYGFDVYEFTAGDITLTNNLVGNLMGSGTLDVGILLDLDTTTAPATVTGGAVNRSIVGIASSGGTIASVTGTVITTVPGAGTAGVQANGGTLNGGTGLIIGGTGTGGRVDNGGTLTLTGVSIAVTGTGKVLEGTAGGTLNLTDTTLSGKAGRVDFGAGSTFNVTANSNPVAGVDTFTVKTPPQPLVYGGSQVSVQYNTSAAVETTGLTTLNLNGKGGNDTFIARPSTVTTINIFGDSPTNTTNGDTLISNVVGLVNPVVPPNGVPDGQITSDSHKALNWQSIEFVQTPLGLGGSFDFQTTTSKTQTPGWLPVVGTDTFAGGAYAGAAGWQKAVLDYDRTNVQGVTPVAVPAGTLNDLLVDGNWYTRGTTTQGQFKVAVGPQPVQVTFAIGDNYFLEDFIDITIEGTPVPRINSATGQYVVYSTVTTVSDGFLDFVITDNGGHEGWHIPYLDIRPVNLINEIKLAPLAPATVEADGTTFSTYTGTGARPGELVTITASSGTVSATNGTITDKAAAFDGTQVVADANGNFTFFIRSPLSSTALTGASANVISAAEPTGFSRSLTSIVQNYSPASTVVLGRYDFDGGAKDTATGFVSVRGGDTYTAAKGFGWSAGTLEYERAAGTFNGTTGGNGSAAQIALNRDGAYGLGYNRDFQVSVQKGATVSLRAYVGDTAGKRTGMTLTPEGGTKFTVQFATKFFETIDLTGTDVNNDGIVKLTISHVYTDKVWSITGLDVYQGAAPPAPQLAAFAPITGPTAAPATLTTAGLAPFVAAGVRQWEATGLSADQSARLRQATFRVADLDGVGRLGEATGLAITIDDNGAGAGWYTGRAATGFRGVDLQTVVTHELGHLIGYADESNAIAPGDIMAESLGTGERRTPVASPVTISRTPTVAADWMQPHEELVKLELVQPPAAKPVRPVAMDGVFGPWVG